MMLYASLGMGIAIVNDHCTPPAGACAVPIPSFPKFDYHAFVRAGAPSAARARALMQHLCRGARRSGAQ